MWCCTINRPPRPQAFPVPLSISCHLALRTQRRGRRDPIILILDAEGGTSSSQPDLAAAAIGRRKPEVTHFRVHLFHPGFLRPEGRIFRRHGLNAHHGEVLSIHPNSSAVEKLVLGARFDRKNVRWSHRRALP